MGIGFEHDCQKVRHLYNIYALRAEIYQVYGGIPQWNDMVDLRCLSSSFRKVTCEDCSQLGEPGLETVIAQNGVV